MNPISFVSCRNPRKRPDLEIPWFTGTSLLLGTNYLNSPSSIPPQWHLSPRPGNPLYPDSLNQHLHLHLHLTSALLSYLSPCPTPQPCQHNPPRLHLQPTDSTRKAAFTEMQKVQSTSLTETAPTCRDRTSAKPSPCSYRHDTSRSLQAQRSVPAINCLSQPPERPERNSISL